MSATATEAHDTISISVTRDINGCAVVFAARAGTKEEAVQTAAFLADSKITEIAAAAAVTASKATTAVEKASTKPTGEKPAATTVVQPEPDAGNAGSSAPDEIDTTTKEYYKTVVGPAVTSLVTTKGKPAAIALLAEFGVTKADQLDPSRFADLVRRADEVRAA